MKGKRVFRVVATTPPAAYNYWMKVKYFARGSILNLRLSLKKVPEMRTPKVKTVKIKSPEKLPKSMKFSNIAYPGSLAEMAAYLAENKIDLLSSQSRTLRRGKSAEWFLIVDTSKSRNDLKSICDTISATDAAEKAVFKKFQ